jgi:microcystin-dependent protein
MAAPFVAEIRMFCCNFAPTGWAMCNGQLLPISQNTALFSLLGTFYGGDGKSTFALPNLIGSAPMHWGQGNGLSNYFLGMQGGSPTVTLLTSEMPFHTHSMSGSSDDADSSTVAGKSFGRGNNIYSAVANLQQMSNAPLPIAGGSLPHNNYMPTLTVNICIAMQGVFPPRQ